ncbi:class I SAM-dependent methyltransferase [soil metagenome]
MKRDPIVAVDADAAWRRIHAAACAPYRRAGKFAWYFARGKLRWDPVFRAALEHGWLGGDARILDLGCGQGLLVSLVLAAQQSALDGHWPAEWATPPLPLSLHGVELMPRDVDRARAALGSRAGFMAGDIRQAELPGADTVVLLDVIHYIDPLEQERVLSRIRQSLSSQGRLLMRVGDAAGGRRYRFSQWADRVITHVRGHRAAPSHTRSVDEWRECLARLGFEVESKPMSAGTPFANVLLLAKVVR